MNLKHWTNLNIIYRIFTVICLLTILHNTYESAENAQDAASYSSDCNGSVYQLEEKIQAIETKLKKY